MPTFLSDPPLAVYLVLLAAVIVLGLVWLGRRDRRSLVAALIAVGLLRLVVLIDALVESPREESVRRAKVMQKAADTRDPAAFTAELADTVEYSNGGTPVKLTREQIRNGGFWEVLRQHQVHVAVWDFSRDDVKQI